MPRARRPTSYAALVHFHFQHAGRPRDDRLHRGEIVIVQTIDGAEACAQRGGDQRQARRRADHGKVRQLQADGTGRGSLADHDIQGEVLHGRIEHFLHSAAEAMDFVDEEHIAGPQVGQDGGQVPGALDGRSGRDLDVDAHLIGNHVGQGGLAEAGRTVKQDMIQGFAALAGG